MEFNYKKSLIIGLGLFTAGITWNLFNSYVPIFLSYYGISFVLIGFIMTIDNFAAITIQPYIGARSDKTWSDKFGRRMPYIIIGIPLAAFSFMMIPLFLPSGLINFGNFVFSISNEIMSFVFLSSWIICFDIAMAIYRAPVTALLPDLIEDKYRSRANGIVNLMGGIGAVFAYTIGAILYKIAALIPFVITSILMVISLFILVLKIKENKIPVGTIKEEDKVNIIECFKEIFSKEQKSIFFIFFATFCWYFGYQAVGTWFTTYGVRVLYLSEAEASSYLSLIIIPFIIATVPSGILGEKISRKKSILIGLIIIISCFTVISLHNLLFFIPVPPILIPLSSINPPYLLRLLIIIIFPIMGVSWALIEINSLTIVWKMGEGEKQGAYTGVFYFFSQAAAIIGPSVVGLFFDIFKSPLPLFWVSLVFFLFALISMIAVKSGDYKNE